MASTVKLKAGRGIIHTEYAGDTTKGRHEVSGNAKRLMKQEFFKGVARDVPEGMRQRLKDAGVLK